MTIKKLLEDLLTEYDELDMQPMILIPDPLDRAKRWKRELEYVIRHLEAEVAREIFEEIERIFDQHTEGGYYLNGVWFHKRLDLDTREAIAELKKKYTESE